MSYSRWRGIFIFKYYHPVIMKCDIINKVTKSESQFSIFAIRANIFFKVFEINEKKCSWKSSEKTKTKNPSASQCFLTSLLTILDYISAFGYTQNTRINSLVVLVFPQGLSPKKKYKILPDFSFNLQKHCKSFAVHGNTFDLFTVLTLRTP